MPPAALRRNHRMPSATWIGERDNRYGSVAPARLLLVPASAADVKRLRTSAAATSFGGCAFGYAKCATAVPRWLVIRSIERSSSSAAVAASTRSRSAWPWVCDPTVTSPVLTASASALHETGAALRGNDRCSSTNAVAT